MEKTFGDNSAFSLPCLGRKEEAVNCLSDEKVLKAALSVLINAELSNSPYSVWRVSDNFVEGTNREKIYDKLEEIEPTLLNSPLDRSRELRVIDDFLSTSSIRVVRRLSKKLGEEISEVVYSYLPFSEEQQARECLAIFIRALFPDLRGTPYSSSLQERRFKAFNFLVEQAKIRYSLIEEAVTNLEKKQVDTQLRSFFAVKNNCVKVHQDVKDLANIKHFNCMEAFTYSEKEFSSLIQTLSQKGIQSLSISCAKPTGKTGFKNIQQLIELKKLHLGLYSGLVKASLLKNLTQLVNLGELSLISADIDGKTFDHLSLLPNLSVLNLSVIGRELSMDFETLENLSRTLGSNLRELNLSGRNFVHGFGEEQAKRFTALENLKITCYEGQDFILNLSEISNLRFLKVYSYQETSCIVKLVVSLLKKKVEELNSSEKNSDEESAEPIEVEIKLNFEKVSIVSYAFDFFDRSDLAAEFVAQGVSDQFLDRISLESKPAPLVRS